MWAYRRGKQPSSEDEISSEVMQTNRHAGWTDPGIDRDSGVDRRVRKRASRDRGRAEQGETGGKEGDGKHG